MKKLFSAIALILLIPLLSWAACPGGICETDATPTVAEVQDIIDNTATAGDTIKFMGSATWTDVVTIGKALTISGNGKTLTSTGSLPNGFFYITGFSSTSLMRVTGFIFELNAATDVAINVDTVTLTQLRIDHNTFNHGLSHVNVEGSYGVVDNNLFYNSTAYCVGYGNTRTQADAAWASLSPGTSNALFVENNQFIKDADYAGVGYGSDIDTEQGGKLVLRYNTWDLTNSPLGTTQSVAMIQTHGSDHGTDWYWQLDATSHRAMAIFEMYNNRFVGPRHDFIAKIRGGSNLIFNNNIANAVSESPRIYFYEEEYYLVNFSPIRTSWPAEDQVHNTFIWGNLYNGTAYFNDASHFSITPSNVNCAGNLDPYSCCTGSGTGTCGDGSGDTSNPFIQRNRDYFLAAPAATGGKDVFSGGSPTLNGASNTAPTNGLTNGTMSFTADGANAYYPYAMYTCPHPLAGLTGSCNSTAGTGGYNIATGSLIVGPGGSMSVGSGGSITF